MWRPVRRKPKIGAAASGLALVAATVAFGTPLARIPTAPSTSPGDTTCTPVRNVDSVLVRSRITVFGEIHGTDALPEFVGNVLCHAWKRRLPVTLGVELASESSASLDAFVHSSADSARARATLLGDSIWHGSFLDGRNSLAMAQLLEQARALARAGGNVRVVAFSRPSQPNRDSTMAAELARVLAGDTSRVVIILTGNIHSRVVPGVAVDSAFRPMALRLKDLVRPRRVIGLNASYQMGTAWICLSDGSPCGPHAIKGHETIPPQGIELGPIEGRYDGVYGVGPIAASPPAVAVNGLP